MKEEEETSKSHLEEKKSIFLITPLFLFLSHALFSRPQKMSSSSQKDRTGPSAAPAKSQPPFYSSSSFYAQA